MTVKKLGDDEMTVDIDGKDVEMLRFVWIDGSESAYAESEGGTVLAYSMDRIRSFRCTWASWINKQCDTGTIPMSKALVAYFSASGVTSGLAQKLASSIGADIFEIVPVKRYTAADLDWRDKTSRSSIEMNDKSCRPPISTKTDISLYDVIFVGFPVWWFREPSIIDTFMESYDFTGKTIVPFATSGGTDIGSSGKNMAALAPGAKVEEGKRFSAEIPADKLKEWASAWI